jgi:tetratricopeptide (TPR) repeat protein
VYENDPAAAVRVMDEALRRYPLDSLAPADRPYLDIAAVYAKSGRADLTRHHLEEWRKAIPENQRREEWATGLKGLLLILDGRTRDAIPLLRYAVDSGCARCGWALELGRAWEALGQPDSAIVALKLAFTPDAWPHTDDYDTRAAVLRRLGELYEARGDRTAAVEYYTQFTDLWKDADPELQPQLRAVKERIARLVGEQPRS